MLPLASADRHGLVVYVGTLSKILAPGLRIGFVVAPAAVVDAMTNVRVTADLQGDLAVECAIAELFATGELDRYVRRMRRAHHSRRDALVQALADQLGGALTFDVPSGRLPAWRSALAEIRSGLAGPAGLRAIGAVVVAESHATINASGMAKHRRVYCGMLPPENGAKGFACNMTAVQISGRASFEYVGQTRPPPGREEDYMRGRTRAIFPRCRSTRNSAA